MSPAPSLTAPRMVPVLLAFVAGAVDAVTFLALFGLFVAQVTGSFVTVGVQIVTHDPGSLTRVLAIPLFFVAGAAIVFLVAARCLTFRALALSLTIEAMLLVGLMATGLAAAPFASASAPPAVLAAVLGLLAMGVQSAMVRLMLRGVASTNVMTTNTTQLAIDVAEWLIAGWRSPREPSARQARAGASDRIAALAPIMAGFFTGSACGAVGFACLGFWSVLAVIAILLGLIGWALRRARDVIVVPQETARETTGRGSS